MAECQSVVRVFRWATLALFLPFLIPGAADAHPLGNFSINHYSNLAVGGDDIVILYIIDMAEIPTFQEMPEIDADRDGQVSFEERRAYLARRGEGLKAGLLLKVNGQPLPIERAAVDLLFPPGAGGLPTMKIGVRYRADVRKAELRATNHLEYRDTNFPGRAGWKEVVVTEAGNARLLESSVPLSDRSNQLSDYPADIINNPPQELEANVRFSVWDGQSVVGTGPVRRGVSEAVDISPLAASKRSLAQEDGEATIMQVPVIGEEALSSSSASGGGETPPLARGRGMTAAATSSVPAIFVAPDGLTAAVERSNTEVPIVKAPSTPRSAFTELITTRDLSFEILLLSLMVAFTLGAFHALEPGHGKTVVAAYLVGSKGTARHALLLGGIVTASHTFGVYLLGVITLYMSSYILPERLYPWLGFVSGLTIVGMGGFLFLKYLRRGLGPAHDHEQGDPHASAYHVHAQGEPHHHHGHDHSHGGTHHHTSHTEIGREGGEVSYRELFALGITGGIIPCPAALVVLLSAISLNRIGFGLVLIVAFSVGLAAVLMGIGLLMVYARGLMTIWGGEGRVLQRLPLVSSMVIAILGFAIALQALIAGGVFQLRL